MQSKGWKIQGPSKRSSSGLLYPIVSPIKECNQKGGKCKISWALQSPVSSLQALLKVEASHGPKQAQHLPISRKVQNGIRASLISREWVLSIDLSDTYFHIPIHPAIRSTFGSSTVLKCSSSPPSLLAQPRPYKFLQ